MFRLPSTLELPTRPNSPTIKTTDVLGKGNTNRNPEKKPIGNAFTYFKGALAKQVKTDDLFPDDIIIAVMGPTGSGKSSFINAITGLETGVGGLESCTSKVSNVRLSIPEIAFGDLVLVDTPGFDDTHMRDVDILKMVADWLKSKYEKNIKLSGLLYFHRISDNRMAGTPLKNLRMFEELCGKNAFQNIILTTTMWDEVDEITGEERERDLKTNYWRTMLELNSTTSRFLRTRESAFDLIDLLIEAGNRRSSVLLQDELVDMRKNLPETAAGQELYSAMGQIVSQREDLLRRIRHEMRRSDGDKMALEPLQEEHQKLQNSLEATVNEMRRLRLPLGQRLLSFENHPQRPMFRLPSTFEQPTRPNNPTMKFTDVFGKGDTNRNLERKPTGNTSPTFFKGASAKQVKTDDLCRDDIIIAVMGPSGSGKSSFINAITGLETGVGHGLESCTSKVSNVRLTIPEMAFGDLVFVDTPGFDNTHKSDVDILKMVADWLKSTYEKNILLSGLLYFHRISDNQMDGKPLKSLRVFEELCGKNAFQNVILTTTMWDEVDEKTGEDRERELKTYYWRTMLDRGSMTSRFLRTRESAFNLIDPLIEAGNRRSSVLLQDELVDMRKSLPATAAGQELFSTMGKLVSQREDLLRRIRHEMGRSDGDKMTLEPLQEEHQKLQNSLEATVNEMRRRKLPLGQRLLIMTDKFFSSQFEFLKSLIFKRLSKPAPNTELPTSSIGSYAPVSNADHLPTGTIPKDPIDRAHQSPPGSASHALFPITNGSNVSPRGQEPTSGTDRSTSSSKPTEPEEKRSQTNHSSLYSSLSTTKEIHDNTVHSDQTHSYSTRHGWSRVGQETSAPHTPPIANGSNVLLPVREPTSGTDRSTSKPTEPEEKRSQTNHSSLYSGLSTTKEIHDNTVSSDQTPSYSTRRGSSPVQQDRLVTDTSYTG